MSIQSEITRIGGNITSAYTAVSGKGGTLPSARNSANLPAAINTIPTGLAIEISTAAAMDAVLIAANVGKVYMFVGTTDQTYTNGDLYRVVEGSSGTYKFIHYLSWISTLKTAADIQAALDSDVDLTDLVGEQITCAKGNTTLTWDVVDYDSAAHEVTLLLHDTLPDQLVFEPEQALAYFENGLAAGNYMFTNGSKTYYFRLTTAIPAGGQLKANTSSFTTYQSQDSTSSLESGSVSKTAIAGATSLGTTAIGDLNHMDRVKYGSNNLKESALLWWLNTDAPANTLVPRTNKFSRAYKYGVAGFLNGLDPAFLACIVDTVWKCATNQVYEAPASMGGTIAKSTAYTITAKFCLASRMEIFGDSDGTSDGSTQFDLYVGATATDRKKYYNGSVRKWWLRSANPSDARYERDVGTTGSVLFDTAYSSNGVVPACKIKKST